MPTYLLFKGTKDKISITWKKITSPTYATEIGDIFKEKYVLNISCFCTLFMSKYVKSIK